MEPTFMWMNAGKKKKTYTYINYRLQIECYEKSGHNKEAEKYLGVNVIFNVTVCLEL